MNIIGKNLFIKIAKGLMSVTINLDKLFHDNIFMWYTLFYCRFEGCIEADRFVVYPFLNDWHVPSYRLTALTKDFYKLIDDNKRKMTLKMNDGLGIGKATICLWSLRKYICNKKSYVQSLTKYIEIGRLKQYFLTYMMIMNCFRGMVDRRKAFTLYFSRDHFQRFSPSQISDTPRAGFEPAQNQTLSNEVLQ